MITKRRRLNKIGRRGAAIIEFVLVAALLIFLVFGIMEMGFMFSNSTTVTMAAHQGARAAALGQNSTVVNDAIRNSASSLRSQSTRLTYKVYTLTAAGVKTECVPGGTSWPAGKSVAATTDDQVIVEVHYEYHYITGSLLGGIGNLLSGTSDEPNTQRNLTGQAVMRYGG